MHDLGYKGTKFPSVSQINKYHMSLTMSDSNAQRFPTKD